MAKKKLIRFRENLQLENVVQAGMSEVFNRKHRLCGRWSEDFFRRSGPITIELGCGKGEYTVELAKRFPERNFIGVDIKGARLWKGARHAADNRLTGVGFLRTRIEFIASFFATDEIDEIWITFPDPQPRKPRKRLVSPIFLNRYRQFLQPGGIVHLKTDSSELYNYTLSVIKKNGLELLEATADLYGSGITDEILQIRTYYEQIFLELGKPICYLRFRIDNCDGIFDPDEPE